MRLQRPALVLALLALGIPSQAVAGWDPPEPVAGTVTDIFAPLDGPARLLGFPAQNPSRFRIATRPFGGVTGAPGELPGETGSGSSIPKMAFDGAGNALVINHGGRTVGYLNAGGLAGATETLGIGKYPAAVAMAPTGEALIGLNPTPSGPVQVAFRPAGPTAAVDVANAETFSSQGILVGLGLQSDGGAIVVWSQDNTLWQSVRPHSSASFETPVEIAAPGDPRKVGPVFDADPSGWAMVSWVGTTAAADQPFAANRVLASVRAPDAEFPTATVIGSGQSVNAIPAVNAQGDGLVSWRHNDEGTGCIASSVRAAMHHRGAWSPAAAIAPGAWPDISIPSGGPRAAGDHIAVPYIAIHDNGPPSCGFSEDSRALKMRHFRSGAAGLEDRGTTEFAAAEKREDGAYKQPMVDDWVLGASGRILVSYSVDGARFLRSFDGTMPDGGASPVPSPSPEPTPTPSPKPSPGLSPQPTGIVKISPRHFVRLAPIDPRRLRVSITCHPDEQPAEDCRTRAFAYYMFIGRHAKASKHKRKLRKIASGSATIPLGKTDNVRLRPNRTGKALLRSGRKLRVVLQVAMRRGAATGTARLKTTIKASKHRR